MLIVSYDISNDRARTRFSKFLGKFGFRLQYSVFEIRNTDNVLKNITAEIKNNYINKLTDEDSIVIFDLSETCKKMSFGYARHNDDDFLIIS